MNTEQQSELKVFSSRATHGEKWKRKNHLAANLNQAEILTASPTSITNSIVSHKSILFEETVQK